MDRYVLITFFVLLTAETCDRVTKGLRVKCFFLPTDVDDNSSLNLGHYFSVSVSSEQKQNREVTKEIQEILTSLN